MECDFLKVWEEHKSELLRMSQRVGDLHVNMANIMQHTKHLEKLDALTDIRDSLIGPATGRDQLQTKTAMSIFRILGIVIIGLLLTIVFLLTGENFGWLGTLHR